MPEEDHYPSLPLSSYHKQKIDELRRLAADDLAAWPDYDTDFNLLRWLLGYDYDIDAILPKLRWAVITLTTLGLDEKTAPDVASVNEYILSLSPASEYYPGGIMGYDHEGNIIFMQSIALAHPRSLIKAGPVSSFFRASICQTEMSFKLIRKAEKERQKKLGLNIIIDLDGFGMDLLYGPTLKIYKTLVAMAQDIFPDIARKIYIINSPTVIKAIYGMVSPVLSKQTKEKVSFLGSNWKEVLVKELGSQNVYSKWGGTKKHHCSSGDLRMGGKVPSELHYNPDSDEKDVTTVKVSARSKHEVKIRAEKGQTLRWWWRVSSGDLDFWIERDGFYQWPKFRLSTEFHPELGQMVCRDGGEYSFHFDNSHGSVWSKEVRYKIWTA